MSILQQYRLLPGARSTICPTAASLGDAAQHRWIRFETAGAAAMFVQREEEVGVAGPGLPRNRGGKFMRAKCADVCLRRVFKQE